MVVMLGEPLNLEGNIPLQSIRRLQTDEVDMVELTATYHITAVKDLESASECHRIQGEIRIGSRTNNFLRANISYPARARGPNHHTRLPISDSFTTYDISSQSLGSD